MSIGPRTSDGATRQRSRRRLRGAPGALFAAIAFLALSGASSALAATVTVGSPLTASFGSVNIGGPATFADTALPEPGANVTSPVTGTVVRWRVTMASGGPFKLRVLTPGSSSTYTGAGTSAPQTPANTGIQTFPTNVPIRTGQTIGLDTATASDRLGGAMVAGANVTVWGPPLGDGETRTGSVIPASVEFGFNADVQPLPRVTSLSPSSGPTAGGTTVTIAGANFSGTTAVSFGSTPAASFTVLSDNVITAITPRSSAGTVDVTVRNPGQSPAVAADHFTFLAPPTPAIKCHVPKLKGKTLKKARKALKKAHCKLGKVKGPRVNNARVKKQKPKPGTVLAAGSKVRVTTKRRH